ncbi:hypothetical protein AOLI_G00126250 [Acnodon oligacanthus]
MCSYCHTFVPNYSPLKAPLWQITPTMGGANAPVDWTAEAESAFTQLKLALQTTPTLGIPDFTHPFTQSVDKRNGCLRAAAETWGQAQACRLFFVQIGSGYRGPSPLPVGGGSHRKSNCSLTRKGEGEPHDCVALTNQLCMPRPDLSDEPFTNTDLILYVDGSASRDPTGKNRVGYAVVTDSGTVRSGVLPFHMSAQGAELLALTVACEFAADQSVTIYIESH